MRLLLVLPLMLASVPPAFSQEVQDAVILVEGMGQVPVASDQATVAVAVETRSDKASAAARDNAQRQEAVMESLRDLGLSEGQLITSGYTVGPEWGRDRQGTREVIGYIARNTIQVHLQDVDQVGTVIDAVLEAGANRIESVRFGASSIEVAQREALAAAVRHAQSLAEVMAAEVGGELGQLIEMRMGQAAPRRVCENCAIAYSPTTPIIPGEVVVVATVHTRWRFRIPQ